MGEDLLDIPPRKIQPHHRHRRIGSSWLVSAALMGEVVLTEYTSQLVRIHLIQSAESSCHTLSMWSIIQKRIARAQRTIPASWSIPMATVENAVISTLEFAVLVVQAF